MIGVLELSWWQLGLALLLVGLVAAISLRQALGLERDLAIGAARAIAQLYLVGLILAAVFSAARWYWVLLILAVMAAIATHAAVSRLAKPIPGVYGIAAAALTISTAGTLAYVIGIVVRPRPWWEPQYLIPLAGMILGNSMTSAALAGERLQADLGARRDEVEARLALGFRRRGSAARDDDGPDPGGRLAADRDPLPDRGGLHARGRDGAGVAAVRPPRGGPVSDAGASAAAVSAVTGRPDGADHQGNWSPEVPRPT